MNRAKPTFGVKFLLFILFFMGMAITAFVILDAEIFHKWATPPGGVHQEVEATVPSDGDNRPDTGQSGTQPGAVGNMDRLRQSIVLVESRDCSNRGSGGTGTGFIVQVDGTARYIATNAHVVRRSANCDAVTVVDHSGKRHRAQITGISVARDFQNDMAILKLEHIDSNALPALQLLNSQQYKTGHDGEKVITIGYPVPGLASSYDKASVSGEGSIAQFDRNKNYFITNGMGTNPGNSGGPVFLTNKYRVLGICVAKANVQVAENTGMFIPINRFKDFFNEKTGRSLQ